MKTSWVIEVFIYNKQYLPILTLLVIWALPKITVPAPMFVPKGLIFAYSEIIVLGLPPRDSNLLTRLILFFLPPIPKQKSEEMFLNIVSTSSKLVNILYLK